jgi:hypothetical protein
LDFGFWILGFGFWIHNLWTGTLCSDGLEVGHDFGRAGGEDAAGRGESPFLSAAERRTEIGQVLWAPNMWTGTL